MNLSEEVGERSREGKIFIVCSAIWFDDDKEYVHQPKNINTGFIVCGRRHHNCIGTLFILRDDWKTERLDCDQVQGFITSDDRFVDRREAGKIAYEAGQTDKLYINLISENLW